MKKLMCAAALTLLMASVVTAQDVTRKEAVKTTKIAKDKATELKKEAKESGDKTEQIGADKSLKAAKEAKKQAKKNT